MLVKLVPTAPDMSQHVVKRTQHVALNNVAIVALACCDRLAGALRELKNNGKDQLGDLKSGRGLLWERSLRGPFHYKV